MLFEPKYACNNSLVYWPSHTWRPWISVVNDGKSILDNSMKCVVKNRIFTFISKSQTDTFSISELETCNFLAIFM